MGVNRLAEAIIFQATVDYCNGDEDGSFFKGEGFAISSNIAGMGSEARAVFRTMLRGLAVKRRSMMSAAGSRARRKSVRAVA